MTIENSTINQFEELKAKYTASRPESIRGKVTEWAFDGAEDIPAVIRQLESIACAGCHSPAPVYYHAMAAEIAEHWPEIDDALDGYREAVGEAWAPKEHQNFLTYLWFAYEWIAHELADQLRSDSEAEKEE